MPKMSHSVVGRGSHRLPDWLAPAGPRAAQAFSPGPAIWRPLKFLHASRPSGLLLFSLGASLAIHGLILFGFNSKAAPLRRAAVEEVPLIEMALPDLKELEEEKPVEELADAEAATEAGVAVPTLVDRPTIVPLDAFVQPIEISPPNRTDLNPEKLSVIPVHIAHGSGAAVAKLGKIFDLSQLDRIPEALVRAPPIFPVSLKRDHAEATVVLGFIVSSNGGVVAPYVIRGSVNRGFDEAAIAGVDKWKFRPGVKAGRKVNTRMQVEIIFRLTDAD